MKFGRGAVAARGLISQAGSLAWRIHDDTDSPFSGLPPPQYRSSTRRGNPFGERLAQQLREYLLWSWMLPTERSVCVIITEAAVNVKVDTIWAGYITRRLT